ncbi:hypothetical protein GGU11DRAFT_819152 [Lentinula aff. detonsa]|nr:hypothetical protein GGU11DRAFT_819152 [Lentinula aff. detonsa]
MHLVFLNLGSLLLPLWRGTIRCDPGDDKANWPWVTLTGDNWKHHGEEVAAATKYFPSFFYRPPRNPAEKLNSGFKASEWWNYLFGMGPNYFRPYLPKQYWENFCRLARKQKRASMPSTHASLIQFVEDFETLYYQRFIERMHFCCPCIHYCIHAVPETYRMGPLGLISQFTMERTIGNLGEEVRQPSNPFRNLSERCKRRACVNALLAMCPELDYTVSTHARYSVDTGHGYILLHPRDKGKIRRYGRLQLPNGQIARSLWSETRQANSSHTTRITRNVLVGEINIQNKTPYALVSLYSECNEQLLRESHGACWTGKYTGNNGLKIVEGSKIQSVLSMHPLLHVPGDPPEYEGLWLTHMICDFNLLVQSSSKSNLFYSYCPRQ